MSQKEFDEYMCRTYPEMFCERNLPMSETCMCWGFCIGPGWYNALDTLCHNLELIQKQTYIHVIFTQIKEKFGGARFYHRIDTTQCVLNNQDIQSWTNIIDDCISRAEAACDHICASCGKDKYDMININGWPYDICKDCYLKKNTYNGKKLLDAFFAKNDLLETIQSCLREDRYFQMLNKTIQEIKMLEKANET